MTDKYRQGVRRVVRAVLDSPGELDSKVRRVIEVRAAELSGRPPSDAGEMAEALMPYVEKVAKHAYKITDKDVKLLRAEGYTEDQIFEATLAAALGAANARRELGLAALRDAKRIRLTVGSQLPTGEHEEPTAKRLP